MIGSRHAACPWSWMCALAACAASAGCVGPEVHALSFGLGDEALPAGTQTVSVSVVSGREFGYGCVGPSATLPGVGVVSSTAQLVCGITPGCAEDPAEADLLSPIPIFGAAELSSPSGVVIEDVPEGPVLLFLEAFDADDRALGTGCATGSIHADSESTISVKVESVL